MQKIVFVVICVLGLVVGYRALNWTQARPQSREPIPACPSAQDCMILDNRYMQKLVAYNTAAKRVVGEMPRDRQQYFVYEFSDPRTSCYTAGDSLSFGFSILCREGSTLKPLYTLDVTKREGLYPLASDDRHMLFILANYNAQAQEVSRALVRWDTGLQQLIAFPNVQGLVSYGVIIKNQLYYTVYDEPANSFSLYSLDLATDSGMPEQLMTGLQAGEVYAHNNQLYISDSERIVQYGQDNGFPKRSLNYFDNDSQTILQLYVGQESTLVLDVIDARTKQVIASAADVIDFSLSGNEAVVYRHGGIERIPLDGGQGAAPDEQRNAHG